MNYWLVKTEPGTYSWDDLVNDKTTNWNGIRNYQARNNMRAMKNGDLIFIYHSVDEKLIKGIAKVVKEAYTEVDEWDMVDIQAVGPVKHEISLHEIKKHPQLKDMVLVKNSRLSVQPISKAEWDVLLGLTG